MIIGTAIPMLMLQWFHSGDNSPPSVMPELNASVFQQYVGKAKPAVVLLHQRSNHDCQEFRWNFEDVYEHFQQKHGNDILFFSLDQDNEQDFSADFGSGTKGQPALLWFSARSTTPIFYSSSILEARNHWLILWIERRLQQGGHGNSELHGVEQVIGKLYRWFDGYDASELEQLRLDEAVEKKSVMGRLFAGSDASVYGEVLPEGIQCWNDHINSFKNQKLQNDDVLYDLGCGTGKVVLQMCLTTPCGKVAGIELSDSRYRHGLNALSRAETLLQSNDLKADTQTFQYMKTLVGANHKLRLQLYKGDITKPVYMDGTHIFAASTTWPVILMKSVLKNLASTKSSAKTFATLRPLTQEELEPYKGLVVKWKTVSVAVSWQDNAPLHIYQFQR